MGLLESIKDAEEELKAQGVDIPEEEEIDEEEEGQPEDAKEEPKEEPKPEAKEPPKVEEEKPDNSAYARMRWENSQLKKQMAELQASFAAAQKPVEKPVDAEPNKAEEYEKWLEWRDRQTESVATKAIEAVEEIKRTQAAERERQESERVFHGAIAEFQGYEAQVKAKVPDYDAAAAHMRGQVERSIKIVNPHYTPQQVERATIDYLLRRAAMAATEGHNPAEALYHTAKSEFGYTPAPVAKAPPVDVIDKNRKRSATGQTGAGQSGSVVTTPKEAGSMSLAEFAKLTPHQIAELERQAMQ